MFNYLIIVFVLCNVYVRCFENNVTSGNKDLWLGKGCEKPTSSCIKNTIQDYLKSTLDYSNDIRLANFLKISKNSLNYQKSTDEILNVTNELNDDETLEEISRSLGENTKQFFLTHDLEVQLPDTFFLGGTLKVSPRKLDSNGTLIKLELLPRELKEYAGEGRIFFNKISDPVSLISQFFLWSNIARTVWSVGKFVFKFIGKFISERLIIALIAIILVIKLLVVKFLFILPSLLGVVAAKKLIVKVLLFIFPFLHHLFKLCAYTPYGAKHHIHKHQIAHIHQVAPGYHHHKPHYVDRSPAGYHHFDYKDDDPGVVDDSHVSASEYGNDIRQEPPAEEPEDNLWGFNLFSTKPKEQPKKELTATEIENMVLKAEKEALIKSRLQKERERIHEENLKLQNQLNNALKIQQKLKHHAVMVSHKLKPGKYHKHHHFPPPHMPPLTPLMPPPISPPSKFEEPPKYFVESPHLQYGEAAAPIAPQPEIGQSGPFAEPPSNHVDSLPQSEELPPGVIGGGLPASTVDAVKHYLNQKNSQTPAIYPVYQQNQLELESHPTPQHVKVFVTPQSDNFAVQQSHHHVTAESKVNKQRVPSKSNVMSKRKSDVSSQEEQFYKAAEITYDPFYSPILEKIDAVLNELQFTEEPCRERLICSMYKNPVRFSPHSNLVSAELSRDPKDLQKPSSTNSAVIRFYKYVQAARDGQDQRDCIRLYPSCAINTEA